MQDPLIALAPTWGTLIYASVVPDSEIKMEGHFAGLLLVSFPIVLLCFFASFYIHSFYFVFIRAIGSVYVLVWGTFISPGLPSSYVPDYHTWKSRRGT